MLSTKILLKGLSERVTGSQLTSLKRFGAKLPESIIWPEIGCDALPVAIAGDGRARAGCSCGSSEVRVYYALLCASNSVDNVRLLHCLG